MDPIKTFFKRDRFASLLGIELVEVAYGSATARMTVREDHYNAVGIVQGGVIFTLADFAFAAASNARGTVAVAINVTIAYSKPVKSGTLTARAQEIAASNRLATYTIPVTDDTGAVVAVFQGTAYRKDDVLPFGQP